MRYLSFISVLILLLMIAGTKIFVTQQLNKLKILDKKITKIENKIEKLKTEYSYLTSPQNLKIINKKGMNLIPIIQKDIIKLKN
tara:strand:- start:151 stop:402 length:252 start_codon:yes stop_codon:yes gene_type:complete